MCGPSGALCLCQQGQYHGNIGSHQSASPIPDIGEVGLELACLQIDLGQMNARADAIGVSPHDVSVSILIPYRAWIISLKLEVNCIRPLILPYIRGCEDDLPFLVV